MTPEITNFNFGPYEALPDLPKVEHYEVIFDQTSDVREGDLVKAHGHEYRVTRNASGQLVVIIPAKDLER